MPSSRLLRLLLVTALLALAGCSVRPPPRPVKPPPVALPNLSPAQCTAALNARGVGFRPASLAATNSPCQIDNAVSVSRGAMAWNQPALMGCALALQVERFEREVVQPAAQRILGRNIRQMENFGAFACRQETGSRHRLSQHAFGKALDIKGFVLDDGSHISVEKDWRGSGKRSDFLREIGRAACGYFSVVLTPEGDSFHQDNIHLDIGPDRVCDG